MYPDYSGCKQQRGFLLPLSIILVVGIAFLALAIARLSSVNTNTSVVEGLALQAFYAAESGAQYGMHQLFFNATTRSVADSNCTALNGRDLTFSVNGLRGCRAEIQCVSNSDSANTTSFYLVNSLGACGSGSLIGERIVEVSAFMQ